MLKRVGGSRIVRAGVALALLLLVALVGAQLSHAPAAPAWGSARPAGLAGGPAAPGGAGDVAEAPVTFGDNGFVFGRSVQNDVSPPLRSIKPAPVQPATTIREMPEPAGEDLSEAAQRPFVTDPVVQRAFGSDVFAPLAMPAPIQTFDGVNNIDGVYPPDTNGDVGPNHYVQWVNLHFQIWDKNGVSKYGPAAGNTLWSGFGGACQSQNAGDPVVLYDPMADRWVLSQFTSSSPYGECIAVSTSGDPTGSYYRYFFQFSTSVFYDYPHMGVWPDGYYMSANRFGGVFQSYQGASAIVFDRARMLQGLSATYQEKQISNTYGTLLPSDLDGATPPPAGEPDFFAAKGSTTLDLWKFHVDWGTPGNSSLTGPTRLGVAAYNQLCSGTRSCVPQPGTSVGLDGLGDRLMHRLAYRNLGDHEALVATHSANVGSGQAGVRWYEIRNPNGTPVIYQQGTYAPDATNRWLGSIAMDQSGNIALGYSVSSSSVFPGIRYTGRLVSDPLNTLPQGETTLIDGHGSQTGTASRWGDYAMMAVDPTDDCTFWFTTEYIPTTGGAPWRTRIGSFKFPGCGGVPPTPTKTPTPGPTATNTPPPTNTPTATPTFTPNPNPPDFSLSVSPTSRTIARRSSGTYTVNLTSANGFSGNVSLSVSGLPRRTSGAFSPNPVALASGGSGSSTLTVTVNRQAAPGTYTLTITGTGGGKTHTQQVTLIVQ
jgi:hypothetical protein